MTDANAQAGAPPEGTADEALTDEARERHIKRFEDAFRLMDSDQDGEAEASFRLARRMLPKIGMKFGDILRMLDDAGSGGETEQLTELVEQYKAANEQLAATEQVLLDENSRLNMLLQAFRHVSLGDRQNDVVALRDALVGAAQSFVQASGSADIFTRDPAELQQRYEARIEAALKLEPDPAYNGFQRAVMKICGIKKTDISPLQDLVKKQAAVIAEQAGALTDIARIKILGEQISEKLGMMAAEALPQTEYNKLLEQMRDLQLDKGDLDEAHRENEQLKTGEKELLAEIEALREELTQRDIAHQAELEALREQLQPVTKVINDIKAEAGAGAGSSVGLSEEYRLLQAQYQALQGMTRDLVRKLSLQCVENVSAPAIDDAMLRLDKYQPLLAEAVEALSAAEQTLKDGPTRVKMPLFFGARRRNKREQALIERTGAISRTLWNIEPIVRTVGDLPDLSARFQRAVNEIREQAMADIQALQNIKQPAAPQPGHH